MIESSSKNCTFHWMEHDVEEFEMATVVNSLCLVVYTEPEAVADVECYSMNPVVNAWEYCFDLLRHHRDMHFD